MKTHRIGSAFHAESTIFSYGWWYLIGIENYLPNVFVRCTEELLQRLVFGRVELPQIASPSLARKDPVEEHNLDHVDQLDFLAEHVFDARLKSG